MIKLALIAVLLVAAPAVAQVDPSNPAGSPVSPSQAPSTKASQGTVIRNAAPGQDLDPKNQPLAPSVTSGIEEPQRTQTTEKKAQSPAADPAPVEQAPPGVSEPKR